MRVRIHRDVAKKVNRARRGTGRSANAEVNQALALHYNPTYTLTGTREFMDLARKAIQAP